MQYYFSKIIVLMLSEKELKSVKKKQTNFGVN